MLFFNLHIHKGIGYFPYIPLVAFEVGLHWHRVKTNHHDLSLLNNISYQCHIHDIELVGKLICKIPIYYDIQGTLYHIYEEFYGLFCRFFQYMCSSFYVGNP